MGRLFDRIQKTEPSPKPSKKEKQAEMVRLSHLPDEEFKAEIKAGLRRGRPLSGKETVTLRVDSDIVAFFKTYGDQWKPAMIDALRKAAHL